MEKQMIVPNTEIIAFRKNADAVYGSLVALEAEKDIPFPIQRTYHIFDVPLGARRGFHTHLDLEQVLVCVHGSVMIHVRTPFARQEVLLDRPDKGLYIGPMVWREMYDFSEGAVLLVLASRYYDVQDYMRDYGAYEILAKDYFAPPAGNEGKRR